MIDKTAFYAMGYGLYLLTAQRDGRDNGCIVDAAMQSAGSPAHITISCMKQNFTPELIAETYDNSATLIIDFGRGGSIPSTVVDCTEDECTVIRQGNAVLTE